MKCRSGSKAFHWRGCSAGLSPLSACPQGRNSLESLSCQPPTSCPDQTHLQTLPLQPCALYRIIPPLLRNCPWLSAGVCLQNSSLNPGSAQSSGEKCPRRPWGDTNHKGRVLPFLWAVQSAAPGGAGAPSPPPAADVVTAGTLARGTQRRGFLSSSKADSCVLSEVVIIRSVPTIACGINSPELGEKTRSREKA